MELRQLRYFIGVAESQHFRSAAQSLSVAQPALSRQVKALEDELGVTLFERLPRGVRLTDSGRSFLQDAKRILEELEAAGARARRTARGQVGTLRIAFSEATAGHEVLTRGIRRFRATCPDVELILTPLASAQQSEALHAGRIDVGFQFRLPHANAEFERHQMALEDVFLAVPRKHPLVRRKFIVIADLQDEPLICVAQNINPQFYGAVMSAFFAVKVAPHIVQEASSNIVVSLVAIGMGLGILSSAMRWHLPSDIVLRPVKGLSLPTVIDLVWRKDNASPALSKFSEALVYTAKAVMKARHEQSRGQTVK
jgi:DNA-binding transcriptional LysR family regulator